MSQTLNMDCIPRAEDTLTPSGHLGPLGRRPEVDAIVVNKDKYFLGLEIKMLLLYSFDRYPEF